MDYKIIEGPSFKVVGKALRVPTKDGENMRRIPQFWQECMQDGTYEQLTALAATGVVQKDRMLGICADFAGDMSEFTYLIAAEATDEAIPAGMVEKTIPAATWAVFEGIGPVSQTIQSIWGYIWSEFFQTSPYKHGAAPDLEVYPKGDPFQPDYRLEVRVPVVKK
ncbi:MAG: GyrI-like domain-containing protein [Armatimonadota bacterium]|nr:GyrI-like domain-containing protein [Armatimonadota bacterium]